MNQTLRNHFSQCTAQQCERLFFLNQKFNDVAAHQAKMEGSVQALKVNGLAISKSELQRGAPGVELGPHTDIERVTAFTSRRPIKHALRRYFNPPDVKFTETLRYKTDGHHGSIKIAPKLDVCTVEGHIRLREVDGGVDRDLTLDVKMRKRWFFIAWVAEKYILKSVASSYSEIQDLTQEWLQKEANA